MLSVRSAALCNMKLSCGRYLFIYLLIFNVGYLIKPRDKKTNMEVQTHLRAFITSAVVSFSFRPLC
jgi:hypothetical protein